MVAGGDGRLRKGGGWVEWSQEIPRITQNLKPKLGYCWILTTCLEEFLCKMMRLVNILVKDRNDYEWMKLEGGCLL